MIYEYNYPFGTGWFILGTGNNKKSKYIYIATKTWDYIIEHLNESKIKHVKLKLKF